MKYQLNDLYQQVILEHSKRPRFKGLEKTGYKVLRLKNPVCGDDVTVECRLNQDATLTVHHQGSGCSICCASASVMCELSNKKTTDEVKKYIITFYKLIKGEINQEEAEILEDGVAFSNVHNFPPRIKCATLPWLALESILNGNEGDQDVEEES